MRIIYYYSALAVKNIQVNLIFDFIQVCLRSLRKNKFFHSLVFTFSLVCGNICLRQIYFCTRCKKYSSKLDIFRSFVRIFAECNIKKEYR